MNILYICYWGLNEGLTQSTVLPHLQILTASQQVNKIVLVTIERSMRESTLQPVKLTDKVVFSPFFSKKDNSLLVTKTDDFIRIPLYLKRKAKEEKADCIIARGAPAGNLAYLVAKRTGIPFFVESFEPHADYMLESLVWKKNSIRYRLQKYWEQKQKKHAKGLITVSNNYKQKLLNEGVPECKLAVAPCAVEYERFRFNREKREKARAELSIPATATVGVYLGKFGDIYFGVEAFPIFKRSFNHFNELYLLIITPNSHTWVKEECRKVGIDEDRIRVMTLPFEEVPRYLSASDFAYSLIKSSPTKAFCSPIKNGEYWAAGLPIILPEGVADDAGILKTTGLGSLLDMHLNNIDDCLSKIISLLDDVEVRNKVAELAKKERSLELVKRAYQFFHIIE